MTSSYFDAILRTASTLRAGRQQRPMRNNTCDAHLIFVVSDDLHACDRMSAFGEEQQRKHEHARLSSMPRLKHH
jgi:hypothetical protein